MDYAEGVRVYCLRGLSEEGRVRLTAFPGVQDLTEFPDYRIVRTQARALGKVSASNFPPPVKGREYGLVGLIDSGTDPANKHLQAWVVERFDYVPRSMQHNEHGSFVAGLLALGRGLNHNDPRFPSAASKVVDVVALDRDGEISEYDLLTVIDKSLAKYPRVKVWNLSLGLVGPPCGDDEFSLFAAALDERTKRHGVLFVVAAGNYTTPPLRSWPPQHGLQDDDRITPPADSVGALTIGALAHRDTASTCVRSDEPSPFGRRGPGPAYIIKPELTYPGGNCDAGGGYVQAGVISVDGAGHVAENVGTSFATPLGATVAASVFLELDTGSEEASPAMVKALMIHSAFVKNP